MKIKTRHITDPDLYLIDNKIKKETDCDDVTPKSQTFYSVVVLMTATLFLVCRAWHLT